MNTGVLKAGDEYKQEEIARILVLVPTSANARMRAESLDRSERAIRMVFKTADQHSLRNHNLQKPGTKTMAIKIDKARRANGIFV